jgi:hypothetical protein
MGDLVFDNICLDNNLFKKGMVIPLAEVESKFKRMRSTTDDLTLNSNNPNKSRERLNFLLESIFIQDQTKKKFIHAVKEKNIARAKFMLTMPKFKDMYVPVNDTYEDKNTALHFAALNSKDIDIKIDDFQMAELLITFGADIEKENIYLQKPIHIAVLKGNFDILDLFVSCGAEINVQDEEMNSPLIIASQRGFSEIVEYLLAKGADFSMKNKYDQYALDVVANYEIRQVYYLLLNIRFLKNISVQKN